MPEIASAVSDDFRRGISAELAPVCEFLDQYFWKWADAYTETVPNNHPLEICFIRAWIVAVAINALGKFRVLTRGQCLDLDLYGSRSSMLWFMLRGRPVVEQQAFVSQEHDPTCGQLAVYYLLMRPVLEYAAIYVSDRLSDKALNFYFEWECAGRSFDAFVVTCGENGYETQFNRERIVLLTGTMLKEWVGILMRQIREQSPKEA